MHALSLELFCTYIRKRNLRKVGREGEKTHRYHYFHSYASKLCCSSIWAFVLKLGFQRKKKNWMCFSWLGNFKLSLGQSQYKEWNYWSPYYYYYYYYCGAQWSVGQAHLLVGVQRPKPRKVIAQVRQYKYEVALGHSRGRFTPQHNRGLTRRKGKNGIETTLEKI